MSSAWRTRMPLACLLFLSALVALGGATSPASALEKSLVFITRTDSDPGWSSAGSCQISYANTCTGWAWAWGGWSPNDTIGTVFDSCCQPDQSATLVDSRVRFDTGAPTGYGFTGTISVSDVDANSCPQGVPLDARSFLPIAGDNTFAWGVPVPDRFVVVVSLPAPIYPNPSFVVSDHPSAGPTGPQACGACYPSTRGAHSFYYGPSGSPLCPGSPLSDGVCYTEWKIDVGLNCTTDPSAVGPESTWARIKSQYR